MENLEALQKRQQGILESMQYITDGDSSDYAGYSKDLMNVNSAIKVEKDYEIQKRKLDIEEVKAKTEQLKAENQMAWVGRMNNIRSRATEVVNTDFIYT